MKRISVSYEHPPYGVYPCITARMFHNFNLWMPMPIWPMESNNDIENGDMNTVGWRKYGRSINNSKKVKCLACSIEDDVGEITREAAQCLQAFFEELKDNTSIESFNFDIALSTTISASDMRHFFRNNYKLRSISISIGQQISVAQCANVATAMRYVFVDKFIIKGQLGVHSNNEAFRRLMSACQTVKKLSLCYLEENDHFTAVAELLRNSTTLIQEIELNIYDSPNLDIASAENELIESLIQNSHLKRLNTGLFRGVRDMERFKTVLCDTTSLASVCQSNHILEHITVNGRDFCTSVQNISSSTKYPTKGR